MNIEAMTTRQLRRELVSRYANVTTLNIAIEQTGDAFLITKRETVRAIIAKLESEYDKRNS